MLSSNMYKITRQILPCDLEMIDVLARNLSGSPSSRDNQFDSHKPIGQGIQRRYNRVRWILQLQLVRNITMGLHDTGRPYKEAVAGGVSIRHSSSLPLASFSLSVKGFPPHKPLL